MALVGFDASLRQVAQTNHADRACDSARMLLTRKLTLALVTAVVIVLTLNGILTARREIAFFEADTQRDARVMGRALVAVVAEVWRTQGEARVLELIEDANERDASVNFRVVSLSPSSPRKPFIDPGPLPSGRQAVFRETADGKIFTYVALPSLIATGHAIEVTSSLVAQRRYVRRSAIFTTVSTAATTIAAAAVTIVLGAFFVGRPMRQLIAKARRIGAGDLTEPLVLPQRDELGELAMEINSMCERLATERDARVRAVDELRHAHRLAIVGRLAAGIAHELGTPLQVVTGWADMIARSEVTGDAAVAAARNVSSAGARMATIIRELLDFARRPRTNKEPVALEKLVRQCVSLLAPIAEKRDVSIEVQTEHSPQIDADVTQLQQAVTNLVMNGMDAMARGTISIVLDQRPATPPADVGGATAQYAVVEVRDDGSGIAAEALDQIFEPFFTTKDVGSGTGLGLPISYGIVRDHGGWISVESTPGHGACFTVFLPMRSTS